MKRVIMLGLCLAAASATGVLATTTAASAAEPAFFECAKLKGGKYKGGCKEESAKGTAELVEGVGKGKTFKGKGGAFQQHVPDVGFRGPFCASMKVVGKVTTPTTEKGVVFTFKECRWGGKRCASAGQMAGTIVSNPMEGALGYVSAPEHRVGLDLRGEGGAEMMTWNCEGLESQVSGSLIGEVTPVNTLTNTYTVTYTLQSEEFPEDFQGIKNFEGGPEDVPIFLLNGSGPHKGAFKGSFTYKGDKLELKG